MRVVCSIGGSVLAPDPASDRVGKYADVVETLAADHELAAVVGGGGVAREYISAARSFGANEVELDQLGIQVTRLNARLLLAALEEALAAPTVPETYEAAGEALHRGDVAVMGGVVPAQTTDAVAAALAEYVDADLLIYATSVPGVYDADPNEHGDAERYDSIDASTLVELVVGGDSLGEAGSNAPIDLLAATVIRRAGTPAIVVDGTDPEVLLAAVEGEADGTEIRPDA